MQNQEKKFTVIVKECYTTKHGLSPITKNEVITMQPCGTQFRRLGYCSWQMSGFRGKDYAVTTFLRAYFKKNEREIQGITDTEEMTRIDADPHALFKNIRIIFLYGYEGKIPNSRKFNFNEDANGNPI
jgi:hypothetical protein